MGVAAVLAWENRDTLLQDFVAPLPGMGGSELAFQSWLEEDPARGKQFARFTAFLAEEGVADVVEPWQLMRIDSYYARECEVEPFTIPPEELWPNVLPALRLVRDEVVPTVGPVSVLSSYRTPELNACARGASRSNHLDFSALDLATEPRRRGEGLYRELCTMHDAAGPESRMGLGAYYDPADEGFAGGRFHVDGEGYRSWGRSYTSASSPCRSF
ncbi:hypothetical protein I5L03_04680 [Erythrobacter sp. JGD-13]|uniref:Peptidase M15A C-terminal domain-containing protein n=1 Tax=Aurantiacibacter sediminis TaxID=2793064 RepID=A0ABS0N1P0_9SPHN|nr:hypothetical protein [Aurantiacibacter sediminis]